METRYRLGGVAQLNDTHRCAVVSFLDTFHFTALHFSPIVPFLSLPAPESLSGRACSDNPCILSPPWVPHPHINPIPFVRNRGSITGVMNNIKQTLPTDTETNIQPLIKTNTQATYTEIATATAPGTGINTTHAGQNNFVASPSGSLDAAVSVALSSSRPDSALYHPERIPLDVVVPAISLILECFHSASQEVLKLMSDNLFRKYTESVAYQLLASPSHAGIMNCVLF